MLFASDIFVTSCLLLDEMVSGSRMWVCCWFCSRWWKFWCFLLLFLQLLLECEFSFVLVNMLSLLMQFQAMLYMFLFSLANSSLTCWYIAAEIDYSIYLDDMAIILHSPFSWSQDIKIHGRIAFNEDSTQLSSKIKRICYFCQKSYYLKMHKDQYWI